MFSLRVEFASFFSARSSFGFRYPDEKSGQKLFTGTIPFICTEHLSLQNLKNISEVLKLDYCENDIFFNSDNVFNYGDKDEKNIIIHPGSKKGFENKRWPLANFKEIILKLEDNGYFITILLGYSESELQWELEQHKQLKILVEPDIKEVIAIVKNSRLFIGNDSGISHIAGFFAVPSLILFGPQSPQQSLPLSRNSIAITSTISCSPCYFKQTNCNTNLCMQSIKVDHVWSEIEKILK